MSTPLDDLEGVGQGQDRGPEVVSGVTVMACRERQLLTQEGSPRSSCWAGPEHGMMMHRSDRIARNVPVAQGFQPTTIGTPRRRVIAATRGDSK